LLIDWFTVIAQAINFLILVWLLWYFLYKPLTKAIDAREAKIAAELAEAAAKKAEATKERTDFKKKNEEFDKSREDILTEANNAAVKERDRLIAEARAEAATLKEQLQEKRENDIQAQNDALKSGAQREVIEIVRKTLADLAQGTLEERICEVFIDQLKAMDSDKKNKFAESISESPNVYTITSAFPLSDEQKTNLEKKLGEAFGKIIIPKYEEDRDLVAGIELAVKGEKLAWSISEYLTSFETKLNGILSEGAVSTQAKVK
jgi:F-type H+-transporting ATPase subunit b